MGLAHASLIMMIIHSHFTLESNTGAEERKPHKEDELSVSLRGKEHNFS